jgi:hypothetical protein
LGELAVIEPDGPTGLVKWNAVLADQLAEDALGVFTGKTPSRRDLAQRIDPR